MSMTWHKSYIATLAGLSLSLALSLSLSLSLHTKLSLFICYNYKNGGNYLCLLLYN